MCGGGKKGQGLFNRKINAAQARPLYGGAHQITNPDEMITSHSRIYILKTYPQVEDSKTPLQKMCFRMYIPSRIKMFDS